MGTIDRCPDLCKQITMKSVNMTLVSVSPAFVTCFFAHTIAAQSLKSLMNLASGILTEMMVIFHD